MTKNGANCRPNVEAEINPLAAWLVPTGLMISALLGLAMLISTLGVSRSSNITETVAAEPAIQGFSVSMSRSHIFPLDVPAPVLPVGQKSLAFGYLEFDWNAPSGVPGFDHWPK